MARDKQRQPDPLRGCIHLYCGEGKGKTTAAMGLSLRALAAGKQVVIVPFLKGRESGELTMLERLGARVIREQVSGLFVFQMSQEQKQALKAAHHQMLADAQALIARGHCDLLILDEVAAAYELDLIARQKVERLVQEKPFGLELVLTGRNPAPFMYEWADYISEVKKVKHPYDRGLTARRGIEY